MPGINSRPPGESSTSKRRHKIKLLEPEVYEEHKRREKERHRKMMDEKKAYWATNTPEALEHKAAYLASKRLSNAKSRHKEKMCKQQIRRSHSMLDLTFDASLTTKVCRKVMTDEERRLHDKQVDNKRKEGWSHQKRTAQKKRRAAYMKEYRLRKKMPPVSSSSVLSPSPSTSNAVLHPSTQSPGVVPLVPQIPVPVTPTPVLHPSTQSPAIVPLVPQIPVTVPPTPVLQSTPAISNQANATPVVSVKKKNVPTRIDAWRTSTPVSPEPGPSGINALKRNLGCTNLLGATQPQRKKMRQHCYNATNKLRENIKHFSSDEQAKMTSNIVLRPSPHMRKQNLEKLWERTEVRKFVARKLNFGNKSYGSKQATVNYVKKSKETSKKRICQSTVESIRDFYKSPAISRVLPHRRYATKKGPGYIMVKTIKEAWRAWIKHGNRNIGLSFFARQRPTNVRRLGSIPPETCLCVSCTNVSLKIDALNRAVYMDNPERVRIPPESKIFYFVLCPFKGKWPRRDCIDGKCLKCKDRIRPFTLACWKVFDDDVSWDHWERRPDGDGRVKLDIHHYKEKVSDLLFQLNTDLNEPTKGVNFFRHLFKAFWQQSQYALCRDSLQQGQVLILQDFAENRKSTYAGEVKSAYFGKRQILLHPSVCFYRTAEGHLVRHVVMHMSDDIGKDYHMVDHLTRQTLGILKFDTTVKEVIIWSDGCGAQYKGRGNFADLSLFPIPVQRNYFGSEHGKGEADGETGRFAQAMARAVGTGQHFKNASDMVEFGKSLHKSTALKKYSFSEIKTVDVTRDRPETEVGTVKGTRSLHQVLKKGEYVVSTRNLSCFCTGCTTNAYECCINRTQVDTYDHIKLKASASLDEAILETEDGEEEDEEPVFSNANSPALGDWIQLRGNKPAKKNHEPEVGYWFANVVSPPDGAVEADGSFFVNCYNPHPTGTYTEGCRVWQIFLDTPENYEWRIIPAPAMNKRGHVIFL